MRKALVFVIALALVFPSAASACSNHSKPSKSRWCGKRHSVAYSKKAVEKVMKKRKLSKAEKRMIRSIIRSESRFRHLATNGSCKGLGQLMTRQPKKKWASPYWNANRTITYCRERYGSIAKAYAHKKRRGWY